MFRTHIIPYSAQKRNPQKAKNKKHSDFSKCLIISIIYYIALKHNPQIISKIPPKPTHQSPRPRI